MKREELKTSIDKKGLGIAGLILAATLSLAACNTVEGVGEDVESTGEAMQDAARN
ncbi:entericidin A/B family lipoprotein [uncultured Algimonas sp.]|uniref:entericidin A/B family lipoprotein n=1 Tax=uncultured Algimonas sp. TaxID=1547920 RepID=UPI002630D448|nr:entericidin A/B family lipoprotein [uncultured Algimonas sp.]